MSARDQVRLAKNYRLVYDIVRERATAGRHVVMGDLYALARERQPHIGLATVYRALAKLERLHLVDEVRLPGVQGAFYEPASSAHGHFHCERCGGVNDVDYTVPPRVKADVERRLGAEVNRTVVSLHGLCALCRAAEDGRE
jgi:Fur family transcriptional regulator, ferric uptake regulator